MKYITIGYNSEIFTKDGPLYGQLKEHIVANRPDIQEVKI